MLFKLPQNTEKIHWTNHVKNKMKQYQLSERRVLRIFRKPGRKEEGIAPQTVAVMQPSGTKKNPTEVWMMYQTVKVKSKDQKFKKIKIISAWRYPSVTPVGKKPIIPDDALSELESVIKGRNENENEKRNS